jgi:hypothetical protein
MARLRWPKIPGYFAFTAPCKQYEIQILESWEAWFRSRGIATRRVEQLGGTVLYRAESPGVDANLLGEDVAV